MRFRPALSALALALMISTPAGAATVPATEEGVRAAFAKVQAAMDRDDGPAASELAGEILKVVRTHHLDSLLAEALCFWGESMMSLDRDVEAKKPLRNALALANEWGDARVRANALNDLGILVERTGDSSAAEIYYREALAIAETLDDPQTLDAIRFDLGAAECERGAFDAGYPRLQAVLANARKRNDKLAEAKLLVRLADVQRDMKHPDEAQASADGALAMGRELKNHPTEQGALRLLALLAIDRKDFTTAEARLKEAVDTALKSKQDWAIASTAFDMGAYLLSKGRAKEATDYLLTAQRTFRKMGRKEMVEQIRGLLGKLDHGKQL